MAQMEVKDKVEKANTAIAHVREMSTGCKDCAAGINPENASEYLKQTNLSVKIREVDLDGDLMSPTVANARTIHLPMGTLDVRSEGDSGVSAASTNDRSGEIIAEYDNDTAVRSYIHNVTTLLGYTERTNAKVQRYAVDLKGTNASLDSSGLFEVVTFTYTNMTTKNRFKFVATQTLDANGKAIPPKFVLPGQEFPPDPEGKNPDAECWYWYLLIGIAILAVIAAIAVTIALAIGGGAGTSQGYYSKMKSAFKEPYPVLEDYQVTNLGDPHLGTPDVIIHDDYEFMRTELNREHRLAYNSAAWSTSWFVAVVIFIILIGLAFPLVAAALLFLASAIIGLMICKGMVNDAHDRAKLESMLNPETLVGITEKDNGQKVFVPSEHRSQIMVVLPEKNEDGLPYVWNVTTVPATQTITMVLPEPGNPDSKTRAWMFFTPLNQTMTFSGEYIPAYNLPGPDKKQFNVTILPIIWSQPEVVDASSKWVGYGTSLALDKQTDRMHISYLDYAGTTWGAGKLIYRSGIGRKWEPAVVVDDSISWTTTEGKELARYTSIALDPAGNPHISYMDWRNGHLKYARILTPNESGYSSKSTKFRTETVDATSSYAGWGSSIAIDKEGTPHISYLQQAGFSGFPKLKYAHWNKTAWGVQTIGNIAGQVDGGDQKWWIENVRDGALTSIALDSFDRPHISYVDYNRVPGLDKTCYSFPKSHGGMDVSCKMNIQLMYMSWNGTGWNAEPVDKTLYPKDQLALIPAIYTWHGLYSSLAIDGADHPHISYFSSWNRLCVNGVIPIGGSVFCDGQWIGNLKYATNNGSEWKTEVVDDTTNSVGLYTSLKVDPNYHPHISYMDWKNGNLRYATRSGASAWLKKMPDGQNSDTGRFSSLAIDSRGLPRIVYMDYKNGHVKYVYGTFPKTDEKSSAQVSGLSTNAVATPLAGDEEIIEQIVFP
ncbi:MAG: hypothetical protein Q7T80_09675 [Methanoregula sp.]|nr:hypothetical protein [Methanoregula sp.]